MVTLTPSGVSVCSASRPRPPDPGDHPLQLLVELEPLEVARDRARVPGGHPLENLVQGVRAAHLLNFLEDHRGELAVALGEHGVGPFG